jgi:RHS repeat-associated protein
MRKVWTHRLKRAVATLLGIVFSLLVTVPRAEAFHQPRQRPNLTQTPTAEEREEGARKEAAEKAKLKPADVRELSDGEMAEHYGAGVNREKYFCGVMPWHRSLRDVNLVNGNLFKSFTDIQVPPAKGAGLAFQRSYNSNDDRVGPFGIGWTHAYDLRIQEDDNSHVARADYFGGEHRYTRDADGLYSPPPYLFDELSSKYFDLLANGPANVLEDTEIGMDGTVKHFFRSGTVRQCDTITDRHGNQTVLTYDQTPGRALADGGLLVTKVTDPSGRWLTIGWTNLAGAGWRITDVSGPYDLAHQTNPPYHVVYGYTSGSLASVSQEVSAGQYRTTSYEYGMTAGEGGLLTKVMDPLYVAGQPTRHAVSYQYGLHALLNKICVTSVTEPGPGGTHTWSFNFGGSSTWPDAPVYCGITSNFTNSVALAVFSDASLRVKKMVWANPGTSAVCAAWSYDQFNNVTWRTKLHTVATMMGGTGMSVQETMTYGTVGNMLTHSFDGFPNATTTTEYFDGSLYFQKKKITDPAGNVTQFEYFPKAPEENPTPQQKGEAGNLKKVTDATNHTFQYTYNTAGQKVSETNANGVVTSYSYGDGWGNLTQVVQDPTGLARTTLMEYDVAGRVVESTDPKSQVSSFSFNGVGQPTQASLPGETVTYVYGGNGRTEQMTDNRGATSIFYDSPEGDFPTRVQDPVTGTITYGLNRLAARTTMDLPGGDQWQYQYGTTWAFDPDQPDKCSVLPTKMLDALNGRDVEYDFTIQGALKQARTNRVYVSGVLNKQLVTDYTYDQSTSTPSLSHGWLKQIKNSWSVKNQFGQWTNTTLAQNDYTYSSLGNRLTNQVSGTIGGARTESYGYDALSRLTSVNYGDGTTQSYSFDFMGNRTQKSETISGTTTTENYTYNNANMLLTRGANSYSNDLNGNTLTGAGRINTWDGQNRLTQCGYGGSTTTHAYGADGLRHRMVSGAVTTDYVSDGQSMVRTLVGSSTDRTYFTATRGPEYERITTGSPSWYLFDGLGSVVATVDANGTLIATRKYDVYGAGRNASPPGTRHKFCGSLGHPTDDETGLIYMRARHYDPATGRFESEDPAGSGANWLIYANNNPLRNTDASGQSSNDIDLAMFAAGILQMIAGALMARMGAAMAAAATAFLLIWLVGFGGDKPTGLAFGFGSVGAALIILLNPGKFVKENNPKNWGRGGIAQEAFGLFAAEAGFLEAFMGIMLL